jgi:hypothetical protein
MHASLRWASTACVHTCHSNHTCSKRTQGVHARTWLISPVSSVIPGGLNRRLSSAAHCARSSASRLCPPLQQRGETEARRSCCASTSIATSILSRGEWSSRMDLRWGSDRPNGVPACRTQQRAFRSQFSDHALQSPAYRCSLLLAHAAANSSASGTTHSCCGFPRR